MTLALAQKGSLIERARDRPPETTELLRMKTVHDFTMYKPGTLQRRIERRREWQRLTTCDMDRDPAILRSDANELDQLAKDLLINVTSFFRDARVFDLLAQKIVPELVRGHGPTIRSASGSPDAARARKPLPCHAVLEAISAAERNVKRQVFASDVDPDAVATARDGCYPETIEADVSLARPPAIS